MNDIKFYHEKFEAFCKKLRWSKAALARQCGVTRQCLTLWSNGKVVPSETKIRILAKILGISPSDISNIEDSIPISSKGEDNTWASLLDFRKKYSEKKDFFIKEIYAYYQEGEEILLLTKTLFNIPSIIYVKDETLKYSITNKAFLDNLSLDCEYDVQGKTDFDFFPKYEAEENNKEDFNVFNTEKRIINSKRFIYGTRKKKMGLVSKYPIIDEKRQVIGILGHISYLEK